MLIGEYNHTLDVKGRVNFPIRLREELGARFIITKGLDQCLFVYSTDEWEKLEKKISELPMSKSRNLQRFFFSGAAEVEADKLGRVLIPGNLREYALLEKDVVIIGASVRAEIWDKSRWEQECSELSHESVELAMDELGF